MTTWMRLTQVGLFSAMAIWLAGCAGPASEDDIQPIIPENVQEAIPELDIGPTLAAPEMQDIVAPAVAPVAPLVIHHGPRTRKRIALTFDGCSLSASSYYDERITRILVEMNVPATIFLGGKWMQDHPEQLRHLASLPQFELASHGFLHPHMTKISTARARQELQWTRETMYALIGRQPTLFRAPYGEIDPRLVNIAAEAGQRTVQFDLPSGDSGKSASKAKLIEYVTTVAKPGSIVVMHINRRGWHTADALPQIIKRLRKRGFEFVTVSDLMGLDPSPPPPPVDTAQVRTAADKPTSDDNDDQNP